MVFVRVTALHVCERHVASQHDVCIRGTPSRQGICCLQRVCVSSLYITVGKLRISYVAVKTKEYDFAPEARKYRLPPRQTFSRRVINKRNKATSRHIFAKEDTQIIYRSRIKINMFVHVNTHTPFIYVSM